MNEVPYMLTSIAKRIVKGKGNLGQKDAKKLRNRKRNKLARKSRRLNLRQGKIAGKQ